jgi:hypothetical protein
MPLKVENPASLAYCSSADRYSREAPAFRISESETSVKIPAHLHANTGQLRQLGFINLSLYLCIAGVRAHAVAGIQTSWQPRP